MTEIDKKSESASTPTKPARHGRWVRGLAYRVLPLLAVVLAAASVFVYMRYVYAPQRTDTARVESVQAARDGVEKLLTYQPDQVRQQLTDARALTTGSFRSDYAAMTQGVIVGAEQNHISAVTKAPAAASMSASPDHAVVLVFINQTVVVGDQTPTATPTSVKVTLDREGGKWLISGFETV